ncbi:hypothetical protein [Antrihabitans stalactiti]|uniref:SnoaL-like domain-containing protein n=1 Tax=Antrihabitans stalactiti TaxID=2584121 RepID=A0A848K9X6_9NOCA|nr:hypothetical protein [Antrihabitans stalactiti]NMN95613.1 hypothetical protein [Antrihabitans stalactiti]
MTTAAVKTNEQLVHDVIAFLETGEAADGLFAADAFCDLTIPLWRIQARGHDDVVALRTTTHPDLGSARATRWEPTPSGFVLELTESWSSGGEDWTCRELMWAVVVDGEITDLSVYCTGDWDRARRAEHARAVTLIRP